MLWCTLCRLDLRFVPDEMSFEDREARDAVTDVPANYEPPPFFTTAALQHTRVQLTWDRDDENRKRALSKRITADELKEDDFKVSCPLLDYLLAQGKICFACGTGGNTLILLFARCPQ